MFSLSDQPIDGDALLRGLEDPAAGAVVVFEGRVRNDNRRRKVTPLEYEAAEDPARAEFEKIAAECRQKFQCLEIRCVHRIGIVPVGQPAAFDACRYVIDELKKRVPVWKQEHYEDGTAQWAG